MTLEQIRAQVIGTVWQAIVQSKVDLTPIPSDQQEKLVGAITDNLLVMVDNILKSQSEEEMAAEKQEQEQQGEQVLWQGRPFLSMVEFYTLTTDRLKVVRGWLARNIENFELVRVQDIDFKQNISERALGIGDIKIRGADPSDPEITLRNVHHPEEVYETLRKAWLEARKRHGLQFREFM
jgi:hypothetical protein